MVSMPTTNLGESYAVTSCLAAVGLLKLNVIQVYTKTINSSFLTSLKTSAIQTLS